MNRHNKDGATNMSLAIAVLQGRLKELEKNYALERAELEKAVENLKKIPVGVIPDGIPIEEGGWKGMCLTDSIHSLLLRSRRPMQFQTIVKALDVAGVHMGDPKKPQRYNANVKTTIINNKERFRYNRHNDTVELVKRDFTEIHV